MQWQGPSQAKSIHGMGLGCAEKTASSSLPAAPAYNSLFVAVIIISLIVDLWQYNDNNHIICVCAEPVIPRAAPSALLGTACAEEEGAASPGAELGMGVRLGTRQVGVLGAFPLSSQPQNGLQQAEVCSVLVTEPQPGYVVVVSQDTSEPLHVPPCAFSDCRVPGGTA